MRNGASWEKKEKVCTDEEKEDHGDQWDHVVIDSEIKAVISMVCGKRTQENTEELIDDVLEAALESSSVSNAVNTSFVERQNGTDRHLNARKARKTLGFSRDCEYHL